MGKLSIEIDAAVAASKNKKITIGDFVDKISVNGHMFPVTFFAFPFILPIPIPGLSIIFGVVIIILGTVMMLNVHPWFPEKLKNKLVSDKIIQRVLKAFSWLASKIEKFTYPRLLFISKHKYNYQFNGLVIAICGLLLSLPLPPGTNLPPAINILVLAIADIEDDGLLILFGYFLFALNLAASVLLAVYGMKLFSFIF